LKFFQEGSSRNRGRSSVGSQYYTDIIYSSSLRWQRSARGVKITMISVAYSVCECVTKFKSSACSRHVAVIISSSYTSTVHHWQKTAFSVLSVSVELTDVILTYLSADDA